MAKPTKKTASSSKVTRIKASDSSSKKTNTSEPTAKSVASKADAAVASKLKKSKNAPSSTEVKEQKAIKKQKSESGRNPFTRLVNYFKGAWYELRQVRWPDRAATWKMTGALLAFTLFFVTVILLLDLLFKYLFELVLG